MSRGRKPSIKSPYYLPGNAYSLAQEYALNYDMWMAELAALRNQSKAIDYSKDRVQSSAAFDPTEAAAIDIAELQAKLDKIDETLREVSEDMAYYIKLAVCQGYTYRQLTMGRLRMPLNKNDFGLIKHRFYFELYKKI